MNFVPSKNYSSTINQHIMKLIRKVMLMLLVSLCSVQAFAQNVEISGVVKDASGEPIIGASVLVKGTTNGAATDLDGKFVLSIPKDAVLDVSYIGFKSVEVQTKGKNTFEIILEEDSTLLDDVVVVGYATMRKKDVTGSVFQIKAGDKDNEAPGTIQDILRNVPGLNIGVSTSARGGGSIKVRGERSMSAITSTAPMLVLDGMPFYGSLAEINPEDIGQIDILKDASAAAVYGSQAANGVIIISTKKGKVGKPTISFSSKNGIVEMTHLAPFWNAEEQLQFEVDYHKRQTYGFAEDGTYTAYQSGRKDNPGYYDKWTDLPNGVTLDQWRAYTNADPSMSNEEVWLKRIVPMISPNVIEAYKKGNLVDWTDYATRLGINQDYTVSVSGASDRTNYYLSLGYLKNRGTLIGDEYNTVRANMKLSTKITDWLDVSANVTFQDRSDTDIAINLNNAMTNSWFDLMYDENGNFEPHPNGVASAKKGYSYGYDQLFRSEESGTTILNSILTAKLTLPFDITYSFNVMPRFSWGYDRLFTSADHVDYTAINRGVDRMWNKNFEWSLNNTINWDHIFNQKHHFTLTLVQEAEQHQFWSDKIQARNIEPTDALGFHYTDGAGKMESSFSTNDRYQTGVGYLGRLFYSYDDRYMITASIRRDGYSAFGQDVPYANFPSVAVAWTFTNESFYNQSSPLNMGKIRLSWGQNGNRSISDPYLALASLTNGDTPFSYLDSSGSVVEMQYLSLGRMANPLLQWERSESINAALDFGLFNNRITGSVEAYHITTKDMILNRTLPEFTGFTSIATNIGQVSNRGFEIMLNSTNIQKDNFTWDTTFSLSFNKNRIDHLYYEYTDGVENDDISNKWFIGQPISTIWDFECEGVYQVEEADEAALLGLYPGDIKVKNIYTEDDQIKSDGTRIPVYNNNDKVFQGQTEFPVMWSLSNNFTLFKNFEFAFNISSKMGAKFKNTQMRNFAMDDEIESGYNFLKRPYWTPETPYKDWGRINAQFPAGASGAALLCDQSFIRFENISLAYRVPKSIVSHIGISSLKINATVRNAGVISFCNWKYGDPETLGRINRTYTIGVNLTL